MRKIISFMHISLDGFVAGPNGEMNWIKVDEEIFDYVGKRIREGDTALYGRVTYQMMESYWPTAGSKPAATKHDIEHAKWYSKVHKVVLSRTMNPDIYWDASLPTGTLTQEGLPAGVLAQEGLPTGVLTQEGLTNTKIISDNLADRINEIKQQAGSDILLFGSPTATHSLMQLNLIDGYWLFVNPIILGRGIPLFVDIKDKIKLNLLTTRQFTCGVTELNYIVDTQ